MQMETSFYGTNRRQKDQDERKKKETKKRKEVRKPVLVGKRRWSPGSVNQDR